MKTLYFIGINPGREFIRNFMNESPELSNSEVYTFIRNNHYMEWMDGKTSSLKGNDSILSHMIRSIRSKN